jgi:hypothetical protein
VNGIQRAIRMFSFASIRPISELQGSGIVFVRRTN